MQGRGSGLTPCRRVGGTSCATSDPSRARRRSRVRWPRRVGGGLGQIWQCSPRSLLRSTTTALATVPFRRLVRLDFERLHPHAQAGAPEAPLGTDLEGGNLVASGHPVDGLAIDVQQLGHVLGREDLRLVRRDRGRSAPLAAVARSALCLRSRSDAVAKPQLPRIGETLARSAWCVRHAALDWPQHGFGFGHIGRRLTAMKGYTPLSTYSTDDQ